MAPKYGPTYEKDDWVFCFHGPILYKARVLSVEQLDSKDKKAGYRYRVHYKGWKNT